MYKRAIKIKVPEKIDKIYVDKIIWDLVEGKRNSLVKRLDNHDNYGSLKSLVIEHNTIQNDIFVCEEWLKEHTWHKKEKEDDKRKNRKRITGNGTSTVSE